MHQKAGLYLDPLGSLQFSPDPLAVTRGRSAWELRRLWIGKGRGWREKGREAKEKGGERVPFP